MTVTPNQREFWTPEKRDAHREICKAAARKYYSNPQNLARLGFLLPHEKQEIVALARAGRRYYEIALDYLIAESHVSRICKAAGYRRQQPGKPRIINLNTRAV